MTVSNSASLQCRDGNTSPTLLTAAPAQVNSANDPNSAVNSALTESDGGWVPESVLERAPWLIQAAVEVWTVWWPRVSAYWRWPHLLATPPPSVAELAAYAEHGPWASKTGFLRHAGIWWFRLVAVPVNVVARYGAWIADRPGRAFTVAVLYTLLAHTSYLGWLLPFPDVAAWLPWNWN
jgi:hypothetical protein